MRMRTLIVYNNYGTSAFNYNLLLENRFQRFLLS